MTQETKPVADAEATQTRPMKHFGLVCATVYATNKVRRTPFVKTVNVITVANVEIFPNRRLVQIQQSAWMNAMQDQKQEHFNLDEVIIHTIIPLGWMTDEEFMALNDEKNPHKVVAVEAAASGDEPTSH